MSTTIETLELQIVENSKSAVSGIDALTQSLTKLGSATKNLGLNGVSTEMSKIGQATKDVANSSKNTTSSFANLFLKGKTLVAGLKGLATSLMTVVKKSSDYTENMNLFNVAMGEYATSAKTYADEVSALLGIDTGEWAQKQGIFMTMATGFGIAGDRAATMSQNLTQLGYDLASFYNIDTKNAMDKLKSGLAGELEPLRAIGYDLSQAKLEATALELGISKSVSSMTQAEKAQLRYYAIMTQVTTAHGDMARTIDDPANQMRVLKAQIEMTARSIGNIFIPALQKILPYVVAVTKVVGELATYLATLVGYEAPEVGGNTLVDNTSDIADNLENGAEEAKKLKSYMLGFDELNVINPNTESSESASDEMSFALPTYDFLKDLSSSKADSIVANIKESLLELKDAIDDIDFAPLLERTAEATKVIRDQFTGLDFEIPLTGTIKGLVNVINELLTLVVESVAPIVESLNIPNLLYDAVTILDKLVGAIGKIIDSLRPFVSEVVGSLTPIIEWISGAGSDVLKFVGDILDKIGSLVEVLKPAFTSIGKAIGKIIGLIWKLIEPLLSTVWDESLGFSDEILQTISDLVVEIADLVVMIVDDLARGFEGLGNILKPLADFIQNALTSVFGDVLSPALGDLSDNVFPSLIDVITHLWQNVLVPLGGLIGDILEPIIRIISEVLTFLWESVILPLSDSVNGSLSEAFMGLFTILDVTVIPILGGLIDVISLIWNEALSPFIEFLWDVLKPAVEEVFISIGDIIDGLGTSLSGVISFITSVFTGDWEEAWEAVKDIFSGIFSSLKSLLFAPFNGIIGIVEGLANKVIDAFNGIKQSINDTLKFTLPDVLGGGTFGINLPMTPHISIPRYADGGFPEQGQMFIAREAGAEMVGNIGRRTAVANNEQIVASISGGVAEANEEQNVLLREQNSLLRAILEKDSGVYLDGKNLTNSVEKYQRERGRVLITGGVI